MRTLNLDRSGFAIRRREQKRHEKPVRGAANKANKT
jgi:hypothetical protein